MENKILENIENIAKKHEFEIIKDFDFFKFFHKPDGNWKEKLAYRIKYWYGFGSGASHQEWNEFTATPIDLDYHYDRIMDWVLKTRKRKMMLVHSKEYGYQLTTYRIDESDDYKVGRPYEELLCNMKDLSEKRRKKYFSEKSVVALVNPYYELKEDEILTTDDISIDRISLSEAGESEWGILLKKYPISLFNRIKSWFRKYEFEVEGNFLIQRESDGEMRLCRTYWRRFDGTKEGGRVMLGKEFYESVNKDNLVDNISEIAKKHKFKVVKNFNLFKFLYRPDGNWKERLAYRVMHWTDFDTGCCYQSLEEFQAVPIEMDYHYSKLVDWAMKTRDRKIMIIKSEKYGYQLTTYRNDNFNYNLGVKYDELLCNVRPISKRKLDRYFNERCIV